MKKILGIVAIGLFSLSLGSCKKCHTCEVSAFGITVQDPDGEYCGSKSDLDEHEKKFRDENGCDDTLFIGLGGECKCK